MATLGPFELIRKLGAGATAEVFLASGPNARDEELIALKVMLPHLAEDESARKAFLQEARTASLLRHPNIVEVFDVGEVEGRAYLTMELVRGWSLSALLKKLRAARENLPVDEGCEAIRQAALGLHFAHEIRGSDGNLLGLVHRDVSPQNLIVSEIGEVKVADFGLAKATAAQATVTRGIKGKMKYMPPEQLKGEALDRRSDVFALGAVMWELVTGQALYPANGEAEIFQQALFLPQPHPDEVVRGLSRALVEVLQKSVERPLERRYPNALGFAEQLLPLIQPGESAGRLGARVVRHFESLPRTLAEATGQPAIPSAPKRRAGLPAPPARLKPSPTSMSTLPAVLPPQMIGEVRDTDTVPAMSMQHGEYSSATIRSLSPVDTISDGEPSQATLPGVSSAPERRWLIPALVFAGLGICAAALGGARYYQQHSQGSQPSSYEEIALPEELFDGGEARDEEPEPYVDAGPGTPPPQQRRRLAKGSVMIDSNVPALVSLGTLEFGMTPVKVTLPKGRHRLKVATPDGSRSSDVDVVIVAGGVGRKTVTLR